MEQFGMVVPPFILIVVLAQGYFHQGDGWVGRNHPPDFVLYRQWEVDAAI